VIACFYYLEFARLILNGEDKHLISKKLSAYVPDFLHSLNMSPKEIGLFDRLLKEDISQQPQHEILSTGYVLHSLEASIWCLLTTDNFKDAVLKAVNLGNDTDTTAAITGGLAGLLYGYEGIPESWLDTLARREDIEDLADRLTRQLG
jgi:ADP-ribosylglycohydrolase